MNEQTVTAAVGMGALECAQCAFAFQHLGLALVSCPKCGAIYRRAYVLAPTMPNRADPEPNLFGSDATAYADGELEC